MKVTAFIFFSFKHGMIEMVIIKKFMEKMGLDDDEKNINCRR